MASSRQLRTDRSSRGHPTGNPSRVAENYLSSLYKLEEQGERSTPGRLADYIRILPAAEGLGTSLPSVLAMLRRMSREGLVIILSNKEIQFTTRGQSLAKAIVRRHRLAECMVVDLLGLDWHRACVEGHRLEHAISDELAERINQRLGGPTTNPYGWPIPGSSHNLPPGQCLLLEQANPDTSYLVDRVPEENPELLQFLVEHGVVPNAELTVVETGRYRGVLTFRTEKGESAVDYQTASRIWVRHPDQAP